MDEGLAKYRQELSLAEQKAVGDYDKNVLALSGGALGISFAFIEKVIGDDLMISSGYLFGAWISWGLSVISVLASFYMSHQALRRAIKQVDDGTVYESKPGGGWTTATNALNIAGGTLFLIGVILIVVFVGQNIGG